MGASRERAERFRRLVDGAVRQYLRTPPGGWPETRQAWRQLLDLCPSEAFAEAAVDRALADPGVQVHPDRRER